VGAKAEARPGGAVDEVANEYRAWLDRDPSAEDAARAVAAALVSAAIPDAVGG
jgi:hypothetical protein